MSFDCLVVAIVIVTIFSFAGSEGSFPIRDTLLINDTITVFAQCLFVGDISSRFLVIS
jgi:hypothetical protein